MPGLNISVAEATRRRAADPGAVCDGICVFVADASDVVICRIMSTSRRMVLLDCETLSFKSQRWRREKINGSKKTTPECQDSYGVPACGRSYSWQIVQPQIRMSITSAYKIILCVQL